MSTLYKITASCDFLLRIWKKEIVLTKNYGFRRKR